MVYGLKPAPFTEACTLQVNGDAGWDSVA